MIWITQTFAFAIWYITVQAALIPHAMVAATTVFMLLVVVAHLD